MKKSIALFAALMMFAGLAGVAVSAETEKPAADAKAQTATTEDGKAKEAEADAKKPAEDAAKAPKKTGGAMLQGC